MKPYLWNVMPFCLVLAFLSLAQPYAAQKSGIFSRRSYRRPTVKRCCRQMTIPCTKMAAVSTHSKRLIATSISMIRLERNRKRLTSCVFPVVFQTRKMGPGFAKWIIIVAFCWFIQSKSRGLTGFSDPTVAIWTNWYSLVFRSPFIQSLLVEFVKLQVTG